MSVGRTRRAGLLCAVLLGGAVAPMVGLVACTDDDGDGRAAPAAQSPGPGSPSGGLFARLPDLVAEVEPSVVTVFAGRSQGSGVVYRDGGVIVTNAHVVGERGAVEVALADGSRVDGEVVGTDEITDLAVVRAERDDLAPATFQEALPRPGSLVLAMGSPLGFENSVTAGIVSGLGREIPGSAEQSRALVDLIQTDAPISPGNSGGALVNADGEVVGINEAYIPPATGAVSIGFAIPAATVVEVADQLIDEGEAVHAYVGIAPGRLTPQIREALGIGAEAGVVVLDVGAGTPAEEAGLQRGDVITSFAGQGVGSIEEFLAVLRGVDPGQQVEVEIQRDSEGRTVTVTVGELRGG